MHTYHVSEKRVCNFRNLAKYITINLEIFSRYTYIGDNAWCVAAHTLWESLIYSFSFPIFLKVSFQIFPSQDERIKITLIFDGKYFSPEILKN